jgi:hypothetical protein
LTLVPWLSAAHNLYLKGEAVRPRHPSHRADECPGARGT